MANNRFSEEDLRALLEYIASNPAILFPELTANERDELYNRVMDEYDALKYEEQPELFVDYEYSVQKGLLKANEPSDVKLLIFDLLQNKSAKQEG